MNAGDVNVPTVLAKGTAGPSPYASSAQAGSERSRSTFRPAFSAADLNTEESQSKNTAKCEFFGHYCHTVHAVTLRNVPEPSKAPLRHTVYPVILRNVPELADTLLAIHYTPSIQLC